MQKTIIDFQPARLSFGQALAYLRIEKNTGRMIGPLEEADMFYLNTLRNRERPSGDPAYFKNLLEKVYAHSSNLEMPDENLLTDFFLELFLTDSDDRDCMRLAMKLNDYFDHFEYFSDVLHDFLNKYDSLMEAGYGN